jgi:hypothetical protein
MTADNILNHYFIKTQSFRTSKNLIKHMINSAKIIGTHIKGTLSHLPPEY